METLVLMLDTAIILAVVLYSLRNEKRPADTPEFGPFRIKPARPQEQPARAVKSIPRRRTRTL